MSLQLSMCSRLSRLAVRFTDCTLPSMSSEEEEKEASASTIPTPLTACACSCAAISLRHDFTLKQERKRNKMEKKREKVEGGKRGDWRRGSEKEGWNGVQYRFSFAESFLIALSWYVRTVA